MRDNHRNNYMNLDELLEFWMVMSTQISDDKWDDWFFRYQAQGKDEDRFVQLEWVVTERKLDQIRDKIISDKAVFKDLFARDVTAYYQVPFKEGHAFRPSLKKQLLSQM